MKKLHEIKSHSYTMVSFDIKLLLTKVLIEGEYILP